MRSLLALLAVTACALAHAQQRIDGGSTTPRPQYRGEERATPEPRPGTKPSKKMDKTAPITTVRPVERQTPKPKPAVSSAPPREREQWRERPVTREPSASKPSKRSTDSTAPLTSVRPVAPSGAPSQAEQMQRRMEQDRRDQRGQAATGGSFRCNAYPICDRSRGSYGSCQGVEQVYSAANLSSARQRIARDCAAANNPDPCNCATQCSRVAQCGPI